MIDLEEIDARILRFVRKSGPVSLEVISKEFPNVASIKYRLDNLSKIELSHQLHRPTPNSSLLIEEHESTQDKDGYIHATSLGIYRITDFGAKELQDYDSRKKEHIRELLLKGAWLPIIVSLLTTSISLWLLPKLPEMLEMVARSLR